FGAVIELLHAEFHVEFCGVSALGDQPQPFPGHIIHFAFLKLAKTFAPAHDRLNRDEVHKIIAAVLKHRIAKANQAAWFRRTESSRRNCEQQTPFGAPNETICPEIAANPFGAARNGEEGKESAKEARD